MGSGESKEVSLNKQTVVLIVKVEFRATERRVRATRSMPGREQEEGG